MGREMKLTDNSSKERATPRAPQRFPMQEPPLTRFCQKCGTEIRAPAWKWIAGLSVTIAVLVTALTTIGWILWLPFGPVGEILDIGLRKWRRKDYETGYQQGYLAGMNFDHPLPDGDRSHPT